MAYPARDLVFISYSHADATWLERLQTFLKPYVRQGQLQIWADPYIKAGDLWKREIDTALSRAAVGVVLVSPDCLASDYIMDVEVPALLAAAERDALTIFCIPVSSCAWKTTDLRHYQWAGNPAEPLDLLEVPQRNRALVEITEQLAATATSRASHVVPPPPTSVVADRESVAPLAASPLDQMGALYGVPELPPHYLARSDDLDRLREALLGGPGSAMGITGASYKLGLQGQGGIGKSVLAAALARDEEVRHAFPDGVYWATLGQEPDLLRIQSELLRRLGGDTGAVSSTENGRRALADVLNDRSCLLVVDDAWDTSHARAFDVVGSGSRLVVTTRDATILTALGAREERVERLPEALALELLANWSGQQSGSFPKEARLTAQECGYLPLALSVAGARVRDGLLWSDLLNALEHGRLEFLDHPYANVFRSMRLSVDALTPYDRERYLELAVFPEDVLVPESIVLKLWQTTAGLDGPGSKALLASFERKALLERSGADAEREISFHDLQHDFLRILADDLPALHDQFLAALSAGLDAGGVPAWYALDDAEPYPWLYLAGHLVAAGRSEEMRGLLLDYRWLEAKLLAAGVSGLLSDFKLFSGDPDLELIAATIRLSAHVLAEQPHELPCQLLGRLKNFAEPRIQSLLASIQPSSPQVWLRPISNSLIIPSGGLLRTLQCHAEEVRGVALTSDGRRAVSASDDKTLKLWDVERGEEILTYGGHRDWVLSVAITSDNRRVVSGSADGTLKVWDLESGREICTLSGHAQVVLSVAVANGGRRIASGAKDGVVKVWDERNAKEIATFTDHQGEVFSVAITDDGRRVISASEDRTLRVWDADRAEEVFTLRGHLGLVLSVAVTRDGRRAISGSEDGTLKVWDLETGEKIRTLTGHSGWVVAVTVTEDERVLSSSSDGTIKIWDLEQGREIRTLTGHSGWVLAVAATPDGRRVVSGSDTGVVKVWELDRGEGLQTQQSTSRWVRAVAITPDGQRALSGADDQFLTVWDLHRGEEIHRIACRAGLIFALAVAADGQRVLSGSSEGTLNGWDLERGEELWSIEANGGWVRTVAMTRDQRRAVSGSEDGTLKVWDLEHGVEIRTLTGHEAGVRAVALTPDERWLVSGSTDATLRVWNLERGELVHTLRGHRDSVRAVALTSDGLRAISGSDDATLKIWDLERGQEILTLQSRGRIRAISLTPRGRWLFSGSSDGSLKLWDLENRTVVASFTADSPLRCCAVDPGGAMVVAGDDLGRVHFLRLEGLKADGSH